MVMVKVPATSANLGPGFDVLGMALDLYNYVELEETAEGLTIQVEGLGIDDIPKNADNIVYQAAKRVFDLADYHPPGLSMKLINEIPVARGLGSSAAAIVGGIVAANYLAGNKLTKDQLLNLATEFEGHPDNVAPALLGGIIVSAQIDGEVFWRKIHGNSKIKTVIAIPEFTLSTKLSREVLPQKVTLQDAVFNMGRVGMVIMALLEGDIRLLAKAMEDKLHQPYRSQLVPGMEDVFKQLKNKACPVALSGAGPTLIAFSGNEDQDIGKIMQETFSQYGVTCAIKILSPNNIGAEIMDVESGVE